ncbi:MAG TPA: hypothetical protein VN780_10435 [Candidatus Eisenbacteria bacterium]|jgi:hypothetical protein|nr:hypothetical protein [Candidatus Eisenbacteria bacterium]
MADDIQKNAPVKEIFDELFSLLETLETQNVAIVEFLKEEGIATDEKFAPYLDRAASAANVKWRAHRARMEHLYSPIPAAVQEIKREGESGGKNEAANEELEGKQPSGESEKSREMETSKELGAPNPITGRIPPRQGAAANAEIKTSKESEMPEAGTGDAADNKGAAGANSTHSAEPKIPQEKASRSGESAPGDGAGEAASAAKRQ